MKTLIMDFLKKAKTVPFYIWVWISLPVLALLLSILFGDAAARHPKGVLGTIIFLLMVAFLIGLVILLYFPKGKSQLASDTEKLKRVKKIKTKLEIRIAGRYFPIRPLFFVILGVLCSLYGTISLPFEEIAKFSKIFRICSVAFIVVYPILYYIISEIFYKFSGMKKDEDYDFEGGHDAAMYIIGLIIGIGIFIIFGFVALFLLVLFWIGKGIIWLTHYPIVIFPLIILGMYFLTRKSEREEETVAKNNS